MRGSGNFSIHLGRKESQPRPVLGLNGPRAARTAAGSSSGRGAALETSQERGWGSRSLDGSFQSETQ
eukprot:6361574-Pyramimonas_sp.AAC.1